MFALKSRMISALAFIPPEEVDNALAVLATILLDELIPVLNYEDNYVGRLNRILADSTPEKRTLKSRFPIDFPIDMWSVYEPTLNGEARTNNYAEAAHRLTSIADRIRSTVKSR